MSSHVQKGFSQILPLSLHLDDYPMVMFFEFCSYGGCWNGVEIVSGVEVRHYGF